MTYTLLKNIFYQDAEKYEYIYNKRFNSECTQKLNIELQGNQAFYCLIPEITNLIINIYELNQNITHLCHKLPGAALEQFSKKCLIDEIILTNDIESVYSTRKEIGIIVRDSNSDTKNQRFYGLVQKYQMLTKENISINTSQDIRNIYNELVLKEIIEDDPNNIPDGKIFRTGMAEVRSATQKIIHKGITPEIKIINTMDEAINLLNVQEIPYLVRISIFHYLFGYIHPFYDGNGRTSRFISSYLLSKKFTPLIGYRLSYTIKENINQYYKSFTICNSNKNKGDLTPFVIMFLNIINESFEKLFSALSERFETLNNYQAILNQTKDISNKDLLDLAYVLIQATLFSNNGINKKELCDYFNISINTLDKRLQKIKERDYLIENKLGRTLFFSFNIDKMIKNYKK